MFSITQDHFQVQRWCRSRAHPASLFCVEILPGIQAEFGEPKSKRHSNRFQMTQLQISRNIYCESVARDFLRNFHIGYVNANRKNKKLARIFRVLGRPSRLYHQGYIVISEPAIQERATFYSQNSYEYWAAKFGQHNDFSDDPVVAMQAIPALLNRIQTYPNVLADIPTKDWRVFEEIVAEIFRGFGYDVLLTKKTRDGGKDIIALKKRCGEPTERLLIECKHWRNTIDIKTVRSLIGVAVTEEELPTGIILATTSSFTNGERELKLHSSIPISLELKDYNDILDWVGNYNAIHFTPVEIEAYLQQQR